MYVPNFFFVDIRLHTYPLTNDNLLNITCIQCFFYVTARVVIYTPSIVNNLQSPTIHVIYNLRVGSHYH